MIALPNASHQRKWPAVTDELQTFIDGQVGKNGLPLFSMSEIRKIEFPIANILHPSKPNLERRGNPIRARACPGGTEVEETPVPLRPDVDGIVEIGLHGRRRDVLETSTPFPQDRCPSSGLPSSDYLEPLVYVAGQERNPRL